MKHRRKTTLAAALTVAVLTLGGCVSDGASPGPESGAPLKVGFVVDAGGLNDQSFNYLGNEGMKRAETELGVEIRVLTSASNSDYVPNLSSLARQGFDLVIASGFNQIDAVSTVAPEFPDTKFAVLDVSVASFESPSDNVMGLPFDQSQASYLAGYLSQLFLEDTGRAGSALGAIGGMSIPPVESWLAGFVDGVAAVDESAQVITGYSQTFADPAQCVQLAQNQIEQGATVLFQAAGGCGIGVLNAAKDAGVFAIGSDADQSTYGDHVLTSAIKKSDVAVFETIKSLLAGEFLGGQDRLYTIGDGAVGLGPISPLVSDAVMEKVAAEEQRLREAAGSDS